MDEKEKILKENIEEYFTSALEAYNNKKYNTAATLFFKSIVALLDLYLLRYKGKVPSSHTERFRILRETYPNLYKIADRDFPFYQESYTHKIDKESATLLKEDAESLKKTLGI